MVIIYSQLGNMPKQTCLAWLSTMGGPKISNILKKLTRPMRNSTLHQSDILNVLKYKNIYKLYIFQQVPIFLFSGRCQHVPTWRSSTEPQTTRYISILACPSPSPSPNRAFSLYVFYSETIEHEQRLCGKSITMTKNININE